MFIILLSSLLVALILYLRNVYSRFSMYGVAYLKPIPVLGNVGNITFRRCHIAEDFDKLYKAFPNERFVGRFELMKPLLMIRDLTLIKQVTVKDYDYFLNHRNIVDETVDPLFGRNLFSLKDQEWRDMRATLSPVFTSSKIRTMVPFVVEICDQMINMLKKRVMASKCGYIDVECKDLTSRCTGDVIASCAFGVKVDSQVNLDDKFYLHCKDSGNFNFRRMLVYLMYTSFPSIAKIINIKYFDDKSSSFFKGIFTNAIMERETKNVFRPDVIHFLTEAKKGTLSHDESIHSQESDFAAVEESHVGKGNVLRAWSDDDLVAQAVIFLIAGFDTISTTMSFLLYELALNPDVQNRLYKEITEDEKKNQGKFSLASMQSMQYLDMVVSETLRLWPPAIGLDRICVKDYNIGKPNEKAEKDFVLRKGDYVFIPVWSMHRDPNIFPEPSKFDPERFSPENRGNINPFSYLPFGSGPRNCIGSRFALCELKVMIYRLLLQLELSPCEKTSYPAELDVNTFNLFIKGGYWVRFGLRTK